MHWYTLSHSILKIFIWAVNSFQIYFKRFYGSDKKFQDTMTQNVNIKYECFCCCCCFFVSCLSPFSAEGYEKKKRVYHGIIEQILKIPSLKILIQNFSFLRFYNLSPHTYLGEGGGAKIWTTSEFNLWDMMPHNLMLSTITIYI